MSDKKAFLLRLDIQLFDTIKRIAERKERSINGQIEFILKQALKKK